jgi:hypothetical protein
VLVDGAQQTTTDGDGRAEVELPARSGNVTIAVERDPVAAGEDEPGDEGHGRPDRGERRAYRFPPWPSRSTAVPGPIIDRLAPATAIFS